MNTKNLTAKQRGILHRLTFKIENGNGARLIRLSHSQCEAAAWEACEATGWKSHKAAEQFIIDSRI